jgi:hypothetical protein
MIASQQINADAILKHRLDDRYLRIDQDRSPEQERHLGLDIATAAAGRDIVGLAEASVRDVLGSGALAPFLGHRPTFPTFHNG